MDGSKAKSGMRLDQALVMRGLSDSRTEAQELVRQGAVLVNGTVATKQIRMVLDTDIISVTARREFVSRGGEKLEGALVHTGISVSERVALDVGSSTGGFSDCLLKRGARKVIAVDVGTDQFHPKLRDDPRVELYEKTDIRDFHTSENVDLIVGDVSFISLHHIVPALVRLSAPDTSVLFLIKPQFEVGKGGTKKGIVRDESLYGEVLESVSDAFSKAGFQVLEVFPSSIEGGDGNKEFFIHAKRR